MRADLEIIQEWIPAGSRVLDLGCGDGELLAWLRDHKQVSGYGLEIDPDNIARCIENGVNVIEQDLDKGLGNFASDSFDVVVMTQALQAVHYPDKILEEMLRVGKTCIITFPTSATGAAAGTWRATAGCRSPSSCRIPGTTRRTSISAPSRTSSACAASCACACSTAWPWTVTTGMAGPAGCGLIYWVRLESTGSPDPECRPATSPSRNAPGCGPGPGAPPLVLGRALPKPAKAAGSRPWTTSMPPFRRNHHAPLHRFRPRPLPEPAGPRRAGAALRRPGRPLQRVQLQLPPAQRGQRGRPGTQQGAGRDQRGADGERQAGRGRRDRLGQGPDRQGHPLEFRRVSEEGAIYNLAQFPISQRETLVFTIKVEAKGEPAQTFSFNKEIFPDE